MMPYKAIDEYEPQQRGVVAMAQRKKGSRYLHDGDLTYEECPRCENLLRVRRIQYRPIMLWCPCGYEVDNNTVLRNSDFDFEEI
jgi:hypothetical protein